MWDCMSPHYQKWGPTSISVGLQCTIQQYFTLDIRSASAFHNLLPMHPYTLWSTLWMCKFLIRLAHTLRGWKILTLKVLRHTIIIIIITMESLQFRSLHFSASSSFLSCTEKSSVTSSSSQSSSHCCTAPFPSSSSSQTSFSNSSNSSSSSKTSTLGSSAGASFVAAAPVAPAMPADCNLLLPLNLESIRQTLTQALKLSKAFGFCVSLSCSRGLGVCRVDERGWMSCLLDRRVLDHSLSLNSSPP